MREINFNKKQIDIFNELGVDLIYIFGSQVQETQNKLSDIDVGIVFKNLKK